MLFKIAITERETTLSDHPAVVWAPRLIPPPSSDERRNGLLPEVMITHPAGDGFPRSRE